jgi:hypothetical protein
MTGRAIRRAFVLAWLSLGLFAPPAESANVVQVRVGPHPTFTRVVFELDALAGYRVERRTLGAEGATEIVVTLEASSRARSITSRSKLVDVVSVEQGTGQAVARIRLHKPGLRLREMVLADPPRIVLDLMGDEAEIAAQPPAPQPKPEVIAEEPPTPKPAAAPQPPPEPEVIAEEPPAPRPAAAPQPPPEPEIVPAAPEDRSQVERQPASPWLPAARPSAPEQAEAPAEEPGSQVGDVPPGMVVRQLDREATEARVEPAPPTAPTPRRVGVKPEPAPAGFELRSNLIAVGAVALGALVVVVAVIVFARRRSLPNDEDVMVLAEDGSEATPVPAEGFAMDASESEPAEAAEEPFSEVSESTTSPEPGLFDEPDKGESAMDTETQELSSVGDELRAPPKFPGEEESDLARVVREMERRIAHLETRLDESIDARERLERQVAAQTEELRVQRAAIARTQRALRGLSRSEEEQATEPALRDPAKPSFSGS